MLSSFPSPSKSHEYEIGLFPFVTVEVKLTDKGADPVVVFEFIDRSIVVLIFFILFDSFFSSTRSLKSAKIVIVSVRFSLGNEGK